MSTQASAVDYWVALMILITIGAALVKISRYIRKPGSPVKRALTLAQMAAVINFGTLALPRRVTDNYHIIPAWWETISWTLMALTGISVAVTVVLEEEPKGRVYRLVRRLRLALLWGRL